jgi:hypothetical protein
MRDRVNVPKLTQDVLSMPSHAEVVLSSSVTVQDLPLPLVLPVFQDTVGSNLKMSSVVRKPIAGDGANGLL